MQIKQKEYIIFVTLTALLQVGVFVMWSLLDVTVTSLQLQPNTTIIFKLLPISMNNVEFYQQFYLIGNCILVSLGFREWGVFTEKIEIKWPVRMLIFACLIIIGSAIWDIVYIYECGFDESLVWWWNAPFSIKALDMVMVITTEDRSVLMNPGFMQFLAVLRFGIFCPILLIVLIQIYVRKVMLR